MFLARPVAYLALVTALLVTTASTAGTRPLALRPGPPKPAMPLSKITRSRPSAPPGGAAGPVAAPGESFPAASSSVTISGSVTDANGLPLAGATVWVVGHLRQMGITNAEGDFTLTLPARTPVQLSYAAAGYQSEVVLLPHPSRLTMPAISLLAAGMR